MPFDTSGLFVLAYASGFTLWHYRSDTDRREAVLGAGYWNKALHLLRKGDMVLCRSADAFSILHVVAHGQGTVDVAELAGGQASVVPEVMTGSAA